MPPQKAENHRFVDACPYRLRLPRVVRLFGRARFGVVSRFAKVVSFNGRTAFSKTAISLSARRIGD
jgi:hypothetical protein